MALLFITKSETWVFLSYEYHPLIQDNVVHILNLQSQQPQITSVSVYFDPNV